MIVYEYSVKVFNKVLTTVGSDIEGIAKCYPSAESIVRAGVHYFIGDGGDDDQTLTKATPIASAFTGTDGTSSGSSHDSEPGPADLNLSKPVSVTFTGPAGASAWVWEMAGYSILYDRVATIRFEIAGTYVMKLTCASDGGESEPQYMKITIT